VDRHPIVPRRIATILVAFGFVCVGAPTGARTLGFEERVAAQKAIEQVYWNHRIWPKGNPGPKPPLSAVLSDEQIRARVEDAHAKSNALETLWQQPISHDEIQAEMDRMAAETRAPEILQELFDALGDDPDVIAEALARPNLADERIRKAYARDPRFHGELVRKAEAALAAGRGVAGMKAMGGEYQEMTWKRHTADAEEFAMGIDGAFRLDAREWEAELARLARTIGGDSRALASRGVGGLEETDEAFVVSAVLAQADDFVTTATVTWPKTSFDVWWGTKASTSPDEVIAEDGGYRLPGVQSAVCNYDTWGPPTSITGSVPSSRQGHTAIWTGAEMIIWGGWVAGGGATDTGGRYNPATNTWGAPRRRSERSRPRATTTRRCGPVRR
jgi:hypothetical protein